MTAVMDRPYLNGCGAERQPHWNAKYCGPCAELRRHRPVSRITPEQGTQLLAMVHQVTHDEMARRLGVSRSAVNRWFRDQGMSSKSQQYRPDVVAAVLRAYEEGGKARVKALYPDVSVRSIVERYKAYPPRQIRWTDEQIVEAARMAGLVSTNAQARYFSRPNAYAGSIQALWAKRFGVYPHDINGLAAHLTWRIALPGTPATMVKQSQGNSHGFKVLWLDLAPRLRPSVPACLRAFRP
jgi:AcrR family transcriptional regulator